ncbi:MAG TPA: YIP1 family protein [Vicinamibacterales bacterium]|jgi:hypothetical protein
MSQTTVPPDAVPQADTTVTVSSVPPKGLVTRLVGVITSPRDTFAAVVAHPQWIGMALLVILVTAGSGAWFQSTEVGKQATLDEAIRQVEAFGMTVSGPMEAEMRKGIMDPSLGRQVFSIAMMAIMPPIVWAVIAGLAMLVFGALMGGKGSFKQAFAVVVHSSAIGVIGALVLTPVNYLRESLTSATNLAVLMPFLPEGSFLARLLGMADIFRIWWVAVLAIGIGMAFQKKTRTVAFVLFGIYAVIAIGFAAFMAARS